MTLRTSIRDRVVAKARKLRLVPTVGVVALGLLLTACSDAPQSALEPAGPYAQQPHDLIKIVFFIAVIIFVLVQGLIIYSVVKFRDKGDDEMPVQVHGNTKLEIFWTMIPALILAGIAVPTVRMIFDLKEPESPDQMTVEVIGHRWWWEFRYPDNGDIVTANEMYIPTGTTVHLEMTSEEAGGPANAVIHSFWVPHLGGKRDVVPGRINELNIQADEPGRYLGQCAEYCGLSHANMRTRVVAVTPEEFEQWVSEQQQPAEEPSDSLAQQGMDLVVNGSCAGCHSINGTSAGGQVGPNLTHLLSRKEFAGAIFDLYQRDADGNFTDQPNVDQLKAWLRNPPGEKPMRPAFGVGMPNLGLSEADIDAIVAYLLTLE